MSGAIPPLAERPWWKRWWGIVYLVILGIVAALTLVTAILPTKGGDDRLAKALGIMFELTALGIVLEIGIVVAIFRRPFWRSTQPAVDLFFGLFLSAVSTVAVIVFCFSACTAGGAI